jgi:hypothetical protein
MNWVVLPGTYRDHQFQVRCMNPLILYEMKIKTDPTYMYILNRGKEDTLCEQILGMDQISFPRTEWKKTAVWAGPIRHDNIIIERQRA